MGNEYQGNVFSDCPKLTSAGPLGSNCAIQFAWTEQIPSQAFDGSFLRYVNIPRSVTSIEEDAFTNCERLSDVYFEGSHVEWDAIDKGNNTQMRQYTMDAMTSYLTASRMDS